MKNSFHFTLTYLLFPNRIIQLRKILLVFTSLFFVMVFTHEANSLKKPLPKFEDYPANEIYRGAISPPIFDTSRKKEYSCEITDRVCNEQIGPNFAGHMIIICWGCGSPCLRMALMDARTGRVFFPPQIDYDISTPSFDLPLLVIGRLVAQNPQFEFRLDSNLFIIKAFPQCQNQFPPAFTYFLLWTKNRWKLLKKVGKINAAEEYRKLSNCVGSRNFWSGLQTAYESNGIQPEM